MSQNLKFGDFASFRYGKMPNKKRVKETGKYPVYSGYRYVGFYDEYNTDANQLIIVARGVGGTGDVKLTKEKCYLTNLSISADVDKSAALPEFLYYYFKPHNLRYLDSGSAQSQITISDLEKVVIPLPTMSDQEEIVGYLKLFDDKIEENARINKNLEQQADALYRSFFSPQSGIDGEISTLDQYCAIFTGKKNANASVEGGAYKFFTCAPDSLQINSYIYDGNAIIVSGNGAYTGRTRFYSGKFDLYQRTYACTMLNGINPDYIFPLYWFVKLELSKKIMGGTRGSAIPYIVMNDLAKFEFIYNQESFDFYMPIFKALTKSIQANEAENETLALTRDILLPQLMSGEIDVSDINL